jgi:hypothetical protein
MFRKERNSLADAFAGFWGEWQRQATIAQQGSKPNTTMLLNRLGSVEVVTIGINKAMYDADGFLKGPYAEVMVEILQQDRTPRALEDLQNTVNRFRDGLEVLETIEQRRPIETMMQKVLGVQMHDLSSANSNFGRWVDDCVQRVAELKKELLQG